MSHTTSTDAHAGVSSVENELLSFQSACKTFCSNSGLEFWVAEESKFPLLAPLAQDLLSAPASQAYVERVFFSLWGSNNR